MAVTLGVHASAGSANGNTAATPARSVTTGSCLIAVVGWGGATAGDGTLSDNAGNTWVKIGTSLGPTSGGGYSTRGVMYKCENCTGNAAFVLTASRSGEFPSVAYQEFRGTGVTVEAIASGPLDTATPYASTSVTPAGSGAGIFSGFVHNAASNGTTTVNAPMTVVEAIDDVGSFYPLALGAGVQTTAAAIAGSWTSSGGPSSGLVWTGAVKEAGGGSVVEATGTAAGAASATGVARVIAARVGTGTGTAAAAGVAEDAASQFSEAQGAAAGAATVSGIARRVLPAAGQSAPAVTGTPSLGAHTLAYEIEDTGGVHPKVSDPITTQNGSTLLVVVGVADPLEAVPFDSKGNTFTQIGTRTDYQIFANYGVTAYVAQNIVGGSGHTVSFPKAIDPQAEISAHIIEIRGAASVQASGVYVASPNDLVSGALTTTGPAVLVGTWFGDHAGGPHTAVARNGFTALDSLLFAGNIVQTASAYKVEPNAGTYSVGWDETPTQGAVLGLYAIQGGAADAVQGQTDTLQAGTGAAAGIAACAGIARSVITAVGTSAAAVVVQGQSQIEAGAAVGAAAGAAAVAGQAAARIAAIGTSAGAAAAQGDARRVLPAVGAAAGIAAAQAETQPFWEAIGLAAGTATAQASAQIVMAARGAAAGVAATQGLSPAAPSGPPVRTGLTNLGPRPSDIDHVRPRQTAGYRINTQR